MIITTVSCHTCKHNYDYNHKVVPCKQPCSSWRCWEPVMFDPNKEESCERESK